MFGKEARFRNGQWEAIDSVLNNRRTLVVQKTGWGKSAVYFIATKILREQGKGPTILISPLLSLMNNQIETAEKLGLKAVTINSNNVDQWSDIEEKLISNECDILLVSPERLGNREFIDSVLNRIKSSIGMFVVDEAHCISDWGHDFRPDYRRILRIIQSLPSNMPLLGTTATANERVIFDIKEQVGEELNILRGPLTRESLRIQTIKLNNQAERLAWLYENINKFNGSGIIYCLTKNDCNLVAKYLRNRGIDALEYYSSLSKSSEGNRQLRNEREKKLMNNQVKALVATVALGMGFDKPDIGFVIHYQRPGSLVAYYQQIGRAGRGIENAYTILLNGKEDDDIQDYFIKSAFPTVTEMNEIINAIEEIHEGRSKRDILGDVNIKSGRVEKCLKFLEIDGIIYKEGSKYYRSVNKWIPNFERGKAITKLRYQELEQMREYVDYDGCYMRFIANELNDPFAHDCGKCSNCVGEKFISENVNRKNVIEAIRFIKGEFLEIEPRKQWPNKEISPNGKINIPKDKQVEKGIALCSYGDAGWGELVKQGKYKDHNFDDRLVDAAYNLLKDRIKEWNINWITSIPSLRRPTLVKSFAERLAKKLGLYYEEVIYKKQPTKEQKTFENSNMQAKNAFDGFALNKVYEGNVLIVDDMVDSRWTFAVTTYLLRDTGANQVYPFALAVTSGSEGGK
ncbi:MAG: RecQ family ATP-dependent DNA helicase [Marinisporobacter sp.]|jgi:ATP-dependent DNA helicase RecQ|nr:RecQ family ATP-dependent DNA helicase [Marinisporobacter sp.]